MLETDEGRAERLRLLEDDVDALFNALKRSKRLLRCGRSEGVALGLSAPLIDMMAARNPGDLEAVGAIAGNTHRVDGRASIGAAAPLAQIPIAPGNLSWPATLCLLSMGVCFVSAALQWGSLPVVCLAAGFAAALSFRRAIALEAHRVERWETAVFGSPADFRHGPIR